MALTTVERSVANKAEGCFSAPQQNPLFLRTLKNKYAGRN